MVKIVAQGACGTCASSTSTMKMGIERALQVCLQPLRALPLWLVNPA